MVFSGDSSITKCVYVCTGARSLLYQITLPAPYITIQIMFLQSYSPGVGVGFNVVWYIIDYERMCMCVCRDRLSVGGGGIMLASCVSSGLLSGRSMHL